MGRNAAVFATVQRAILLITEDRCFFLRPFASETMTDKHPRFNDGIIHSHSEVLPSSRERPIKWRMGHLQNRDGDLKKPWLEDPVSPFTCPGYGFGKPTINVADNDFPCSIAYLMGDIDLPAGMTPSFELTGQMERSGCSTNWS